MRKRTYRYIRLLAGISKRPGRYLWTTRPTSPRHETLLWLFDLPSEGHRRWTLHQVFSDFDIHIPFLLSFASSDQATTTTIIHTILPSPTQDAVPTRSLQQSLACSISGSIPRWCASRMVFSATKSPSASSPATTTIPSATTAASISVDRLAIDDTINDK